MIKKYTRLVFLFVALSCNVSLQAETASMNFQNVDIRAVIAAVSKSTGKNFIIDPRVNGKVTLISASDVEPDILYDIFLSILKVHGFVAIPDADGHVIKIVPAFQTKTESSLSTGNETSDRLADNEVSLRTIQINNAVATELIPILRPLVSKEGHLAAHQGSNLIIISDTLKNIKKVSKIIKQMDRENEVIVKTIELYNASASTAVKTLKDILQKKTKPATSGAKLTIVAEERTNSVMVSGNDLDIAKVELLLESIDVKNSVRSGSAVIKLNYADAKNIAEILNKMISAKDNKNSGTSSLAVTESSTVTETTAAPTVNTNGTADIPTSSLAVDANTASPVLTTSSTKSTQYQRANLQISVDEKANSIIIIGPPDSVENLRRVVRRLDVKRSQIMVEALIVEVTTDKAKNFGLLQLDAFEGPLDKAPLLTDGLGVIGTALTEIKSWTGFMNDLLQNMLASGAQANLVSAPSLLTLENEEAEISVGSEVPFVTGSFNTANNTQNPFTTIERKNVGLTLKITPQINHGGIVRLKIDQEFSNVVPGAQTALGTADVVTSKRVIKTTALIKDGQMLVLGGLIDDNVRETESGLGIVSAIPFFGDLFKSKTSSKIKRNLMVFIRPTIIHNPDVESRITKDNYNHIRDLQKQRNEKGVSLMSKESQPVIQDRFGAAWPTIRIVEDPEPYKDTTPDPFDFWDEDDS